MTRYPLISDHGLIGNLRTAALVARDGSVNWCCLPDLDSPSVFAALLDADHGGRFRISLAGASLGSQRYRDGTNVLETSFDGPGGRLIITDFMPVDGDLSGASEGEGDHAIVRLLACDGDSVDAEVEWSPRFDYARSAPTIARSDHGWLATAGEFHLALGGLPEHAEIEMRDRGATLGARFTLRGGERAALITRYGTTSTADGIDRARDLLARTERSWLAWSRVEQDGVERIFGGEWHAQVARSGLALKLLTHRHTGAIAAAPTTSLPEAIGGVRNWDYRYTWVRDAAFTAQALNALGHGTEARNFLTWLQRASKATDPSAFDLQIMYGLHGEVSLKEIELPHLEGYKGSRPVRIGNAASEQFQLDIYGELMSAAYELMKMGHSIEPELWSFLGAVADRACERWREPDNGIWEVRTKPRHFIYSKVMAWVALDRALRLARHFGLEGNTKLWRREGEAIRAAVLSEGYDAAGGAFRQAFGETHLDAANVLIPLVGFLPADDPRVQRTIDRTLRDLTENGIVFRYHSDDGLPAGEGAWGLATFWLVDALALSGRRHEALTLFVGMAARANHLGLFSEEFDPNTGELLGNFPQAFTHIGFVNAALHLGAR
ncbi:MAG: glycoside hydrolase family 15 protein [Gemmatimonadota bacterium]|nr:glycoside hydrolase family 15 protein [Gemmatimonadota bacterium]